MMLHVHALFLPREKETKWGTQSPSHELLQSQVQTLTFVTCCSIAYNKIVISEALLPIRSDLTSFLVLRNYVLKKKLQISWSTFTSEKCTSFKRDLRTVVKKRHIILCLQVIFAVVYLIRRRRRKKNSPWYKPELVPGGQFWPARLD